MYGGIQGLYDYGPLGAGLKRRIEDAWTAWFVGLSDDYYRIDPAEILPEAVVRASGHLENFTDPEVTCDHCHSAFRADSVLEKARPEGVDGLSVDQIRDLLTQHRAKCPTCGSTDLAVPQPFNMMFGLTWGAVGGERAYLRPETAQSSYLAFPRMWDIGRRALPLGIGVIGKAYRNEIAPRQVLFRMRAFTQAELQIFFDPRSPPKVPGFQGSVKLPVLRVARRESGAETPEWISGDELVASGDLPEFFVAHLAHTLRFYVEVLGHPKDAIRLFEKSDKERAFYNRIQFDVEVRLESLGGFRELGAVHYRGDYDLGRHGTGSGRDLSVATPDGAKVLPHVLELTFGVDRNLWALADSGLAKDGDRTVWRLAPSLAPVAAGVFPLLKKEHAEFAIGVAARLRREGFAVVVDDAGSIGRRYARMDEVGTPYCITVDGETIDPHSPHHGTVTVRDRDSKAQSRLSVDRLAEHLRSARVPPVPVAG